MQLRRYLAKDVLLHTVAVSLILFLVVFSGRFIRYLGEAAVGDITSDILLPVMWLKLPTFFQLILPLGLFVGILLSLGRLYADSEMVIFKACGVSPTHFAQILAFPVIVVMVLVGVLALYLAPEGSARAQALLEAPRSAAGIQALAAGRFKKQQGGDVVSYAEDIDENGVMHNVFIAQRGARTDKLDERLTVTFAEEGEIRFDEASGRRYMELRRGTRYRGVPGAANYEKVTFERYGELIPQQEGGIRSQAKIESVSSRVLWLRDDALARGTLLWRLSLVLLVPVTAIIALALSKTDARRGRYAQLGPALLLFLGYFVALTQARSVVEGGGSESVFWVTHGLFTLAALGLLQWESIRPRLSMRLRHG